MIVLDVETTGIDHNKNSIVSIGAVDFGEPKNQFYEECRIWDGAEIDNKALAINGFSRNKVKNMKNKLDSALSHFICWSERVSDMILAGENPSFDRDFLRSSYEMYGLHWPFGYRTIDLHSLCYEHKLKRGIQMPLVKGRSYLSLDTILEYVGMPAEPKQHIALNGAKMEAEAFSRFIYGRGLLDEFSEFKIPSYLKWGFSLFKQGL